MKMHRRLSSVLRALCIYRVEGNENLSLQTLHDEQVVLHTAFQRLQDVRLAVNGRAFLHGPQRAKKSAQRVAYKRLLLLELMGVSNE